MTQELNLLVLNQETVAMESVPTMLDFATEFVMGSAELKHTTSSLETLVNPISYVLEVVQATVSIPLTIVTDYVLVTTSVSENAEITPLEVSVSFVLLTSVMAIVLAELVLR